jgi:putative phage-type endonuclease
MNAPAQGTQEWLSERAGCATASRFADVLATIKTGEAASRRGYRMQLVTERLTGNPVTGYTNSAMAWGTATEPYAREAYEDKTGVIVDQTGFMKHPEIPWCGASPDGLIEDEGLIECKCPESHTHLEYLEGGKAPEKYIPQMQGQMWVMNRQWCDFVSYDPRFPPNLQLFIVRVPRDDAYIVGLERKVKEFLVEVDESVQRILARK